MLSFFCAVLLLLHSRTSWYHVCLDKFKSWRQRFLGCLSQSCIQHRGCSKSHIILIISSGNFLTIRRCRHVFLQREEVHACRIAQKSTKQRSSHTHIEEALVQAGLRFVHLVSESFQQLATFFAHLLSRRHYAECSSKIHQVQGILPTIVISFWMQKKCVHGFPGLPQQVLMSIQIVAQRKSNADICTLWQQIRETASREHFLGPMQQGRQRTIFPRKVWQASRNPPVRCRTETSP
jgi:hypothetical protein